MASICEAISAAAQRAAILQRDGHLESAARLLHDVLAASTDAFQTFTLLNNLAGVRQRQGNLVEALGLYEQALSLKGGATLAAELVLGAQHNYGVCLRQAGREADALPVSREALEGRRKLFGMGHATSLASLRSYLRALSALGRHAEAFDECARAIPAHLLGVHHASCDAIRRQLEPSTHSPSGAVDVAPPSQRPMDLAGGAPPPLAPLCGGASSPQAPAPTHCCVNEPHWESSACRSLAARGWVVLRLPDDLAAVPSELIELAPKLFSDGVGVGGGAGSAQDGARMSGGCVCTAEGVPTAVGRHIELCHRLCCAVMGYLTASPCHVLPASLDPFRSAGDRESAQDGATAACRDIFARSELQIFQYRSTCCVGLDSRRDSSRDSRRDSRRDFGSASDGDGGGGGDGGDEGGEGDEGGGDCGESAHHGADCGESAHLGADCGESAHLGADCGESAHHGADCGESAHHGADCGESAHHGGDCGESAHHGADCGESAHHGADCGESAHHGADCGESAHHGRVDCESRSGVSHGRACACFACRSGGVLVDAHADQGLLTLSLPSSLPLLEALPPHAAPDEGGKQHAITEALPPHAAPDEGGNQHAITEALAPHAAPDAAAASIHAAQDAQEGRDIGRDAQEGREIGRDTQEGREIGRDTDELRLIRAMLGPMTTDRADGWMPLEATLHPHELLLYAGKALEHASAGSIPALLHRVRAPPRGRERFSAPYFLRPSADVALPPVPGGGPLMISANDFLRCAVAARDVRVPPEENVRSLRVARQAA